MLRGKGRWRLDCGVRPRSRCRIPVVVTKLPACVCGPLLTLLTFHAPRSRKSAPCLFILECDIPKHVRPLGALTIPSLKRLSDAPLPLGLLGFELICDQIWQNKCKHFGNLR